MSIQSSKKNNRNLRRTLRFESMESRRLLAADLVQHNFDMPDDVDGDQYVSPIDALILINELNNPTGERAAVLRETAMRPLFMDVTGDGLVSPIDALSVINKLNATQNSSATPNSTPNAVTAVDANEDSEVSDETTVNETFELSLSGMLKGAGSGTASIHYQASTENGTPQNELNVSVRGGTPSSSLDVIVGGVSVGKVTTDATGNGYLALASVPNGSGESSLPAGFPQVVAGTTVTVGTLSGTLAVDSNNENEVDQQGENDGQFGDQNALCELTDAESNDDAPLPTLPIAKTTLPVTTSTTKPTPVVTTPLTATPKVSTSTPSVTNIPTTPSVTNIPTNPSDRQSNEAGETRFTSMLVGTGNQLGYVQFESDNEHVLLNTELGVSVNYLAPNALLNVIIGGVTIGQIQTDANGHGDLDLSSNPRETNEQALPANFPVITAGTKIQIGTEMLGTFKGNLETGTPPAIAATLSAQPAKLNALERTNLNRRIRER